MRAMSPLRVMLRAGLCGLAMLVAWSAWAAPKSGPAVGAAAPTFTLQDSEGRPFELTTQARKGVVVLAFFTRAFSGASVRQWRALAGVHAALSGAGVTLVGVSTDSRSTLKRFKAAHRLPFRLLSDGSAEVSEAYGALLGFERRRLAAEKVVVVSRRTRVAYRDERYEAKTEADLRALLRAVGVER